MPVSVAILNGVRGTTDTSKWFHFAVTREGELCKVYINGALAASDSQSFEVSAYNRRIGSHYEHKYAYPFKGYLAGMRIYNRVLNEDEIYNLASEFTPTA